MEYIFRPPFFNISPYSRFSDAWESFCKELLQLEYDTNDILRLRPPDFGADLIWIKRKTVYQCKSSEGEAFNVGNAIRSLKQALEKRRDLGEWESYIICINVDITGNQWVKIKEFFLKHKRDDITVSYLDKDYWTKICRKFPDEAARYFNILVPATRRDIVKALEHEQYFPKYVEQYINAISMEDFEVIVSTNRAEVKFRIPFSEKMTIENLLDVMKGIIRLPEGWSLYPRFGTSAAINSLGITRGDKLQAFSKTLGELGISSGEEVQLFIQVVWSESLKRDGVADTEGEGKLVYFLASRYKWTSQETDSFIQKMSSQERRENTIEAFNGTLHDSIWNAAKRLVQQHLKSDKSEV